MLKSISKFLAVGVLLVPASALAVPITVDFTVTGTTALGVGNESTADYLGYPVGTTGSGWFTIDDSIGFYNNGEVGLTPIDFNFEWLGVTFTEETAQLSSVSFDGTGVLRNWSFGFPGGQCPQLYCMSADGPTDFMLSANNATLGFAALHSADAYGWMLGDLSSWSVRPSSSVPEPATLGLLGFGLLGAAFARRKRAI